MPPLLSSVMASVYPIVKPTESAFEPFHSLHLALQFPLSSPPLSFRCRFPVTRYRFRCGTSGTFVLLTPARPCANYVSMSMETLTRAWEVLQDASQAQMEGDYDPPLDLYHPPLELHPPPLSHPSLP